MLNAFASLIKILKEKAGVTYKGLLILRLLSRFRRRSTRAHVPNLTDELSTAKERRLNQFGMAVLVRCGKSSTESIEVLSNLTLARHTVRNII